LIIFDLRCGMQGHVFEAWFGSSDDYEEQQSRGLVACPICGSKAIAKAPMAPSLGARGNRGLSSDDAQKVKAMLAAAAAVQKKMLEGSESVGERFADEARAIHLGESAARAIHGRATSDEAESLIEDGIPVASLPFPVPEPGAEN
jgi:hypothetical protein